MEFYPTNLFKVKCETECIPACISLRAGPIRYDVAVLPPIVGGPGHTAPQWCGFGEMGTRYLESNAINKVGDEAEEPCFLHPHPGLLGGRRNRLLADR